MSQPRHEDDGSPPAESSSDRQRLELRSVGRLPCDNRAVQGNARSEQSSDPPPRKAIRGMSWFKPAPEPVSRTPPHADERSVRRRLLGTGADPSWWIRDIVVALLIALLVLVGQKWVDDSRADRDRAIAADQNRQAQRLENLRFVRDRSSGDQDQPRPFAGLDLAGMNLAGLYLRGADFSAADLEGANLNLTDLAAPDAPDPLSSLGQLRPIGSPTDFTGANLCGADLVGANLGGANLTRANLSGADLRFTLLSETVLYGADLSETQLKQEFLRGVSYDNSTIWPDGFTPPPSAGKVPMAMAALGQLWSEIPRPDCD